MHTRTFSAAREGIEGSLVEIEAVSLNSLPQIQITGLPGEVVKESRDRVKACLSNLGYDVPTSRVLIHLSPANTKKLGSHYDLAITLSVLGAEGKLGEVRLQEFGFLGELSLDGRIQPVVGGLALIEALVRMPEIKTILIPSENALEGALLQSKKLRLVENLGQVLDFLRNRSEVPSCPIINEESPNELSVDLGPNLDQVVGQSLAKRALQISLAGRHPLLLMGPPGVGKSTLANCAAALLPPLTGKQRIENLKINSAFPKMGDARVKGSRPPFRTPHHTVSSNALLGGGNGNVVPGEISLAHQGILFLDEFPEFRRDAIEGMREPMQSGIFAIQRVGHALKLPARFTLIAAMNPCPCGMAGGLENRCRCAPEKKLQYRRKLSSPILDRMALMVQLRSAHEEFGLEAGTTDDVSHAVAKREIQRAHEIQFKRLGEGVLNGDVEFVQEWEEFALLGTAKEWANRFTASNSGMSYRRMGQWRKVARTIADLEDSSSITVEHLSEAWSLRCFDTYPI